MTFITPKALPQRQLQPNEIQLEPRFFHSLDHIEQTTRSLRLERTLDRETGIMTWRYRLADADALNELTETGLLDFGLEG